MVILLAIVSPAASLDTNASKTPGINAPITEQNILKILNRYDKDGAYIIKKQLIMYKRYITMMIFMISLILILILQNLLQVQR